MEKVLSHGKNFGNENLKTYELMFRFSGHEKKVTQDDIETIKYRFEAVVKPIQISSYLTRKITLNELGGSVICYVVYENSVYLISADDWTIIRNDSDSLAAQLENLLTPLLG
ncbi:MAG TPA: hypothetical protein PLI16_10200 [Bacteroidales bacterium]|nr:hypothetical protein [Bacteroidales bacterium]HOH84970.1 hypothetical protein [Bacteroidales bacterium]